MLSARSLPFSRGTASGYQCVMPIRALCVSHPSTPTEKGREINVFGLVLFCLFFLPYRLLLSNSLVQIQCRANPSAVKSGHSRAVGRYRSHLLRDSICVCANRTNNQPVGWSGGIAWTAATRRKKMSKRQLW